MQQDVPQTSSLTLESDLRLERPEDFLSPEQRIHGVAEILATIALRAMKQEQPQDQHQHHEKVSHEHSNA